MSHGDDASVLKDIRQLSAAINPDFLAYPFALRDGRMLTGVLNGSTDREVRIGGVVGKILAIPRAAVAELAPSRVSIMPEKLLERLDAEGVRNLLAFLLIEGPHKVRECRIRA